MRLYQVPYSHYSAKVRLVLLEKNIPAELALIPAKKKRGKGFKSINPTGLAPCLVHNELHLGESEVIVEYLEEKYPAPSMLPSSAGDRARSRWISRIHDLYVAPDISALYEYSQAGDVPGDASRETLHNLFNHLDLIEAAVTPAPFFFGEQYGLSDASLSLSFWYANLLSGLCGTRLDDARYPKLLEWFQAVDNRVAFTEVLRDCKVSLGISEPLLARVA